MLNIFGTIVENTVLKQINMETNTPLKIFMVDDDMFCLNLYEQHLRNLGYSDIQTFDNGTSCLNSLMEQPDIIFLDHGMDILNGLDILKKIKRVDPDIYVVFISGQEDIQTAVNSLKYGALDYIVKRGNEAEKIEQVMVKILEIKELLKKGNRSIIRKFFHKSLA
jgi:polysaccharide export outer membrane protein